MKLADFVKLNSIDHKRKWYCGITAGMAERILSVHALIRLRMAIYVTRFDLDLRKTNRKWWQMHDGLKVVWLITCIELIC
jgi:hypothetical protein